MMSNKRRFRRSKTDVQRMRVRRMYFLAMMYGQVMDKELIALWHERMNLDWITT